MRGWSARCSKRGSSWRATEQPRSRAGSEAAPAGGDDRIEALEAELAEIEQRQRGELDDELRGLHEDGERETARVRELEHELAQARDERARADELVRQAREGDV